MTTNNKNATVIGPLAEGQRWRSVRKREVVLRMLRGESVDALSRELNIEIYRLEEWREKALTGIDDSLKNSAIRDTPHISNKSRVPKLNLKPMTSAQKSLPC